MGRALRVVERSRQWFARKGKELIQDHWDLGLFDIAFGSAKVFGIYPALYFAGLTWTIPIMEYGPLNTQLWTAGYLFSRRQILSKLGERRYGRSLNEMDDLRDHALRIHPRDARRIHRFEYEGVNRTIRIGRSRVFDWIRRLRGLSRESNVVLQSELRAMISDKEFLFQANQLRNNPFLFEEIAIKKILSTSEDRPKLLNRLAPEEPLEDARDRKLFATVGDSLIPAYARVIEQGDSLTQALRRNLGSSFSATSLSLRWVNWSYQRTIYRMLAGLERLSYQLLAEILDGRCIDGSDYVPRICERRAEIQTWIDRATGFGERAKRVLSKPQGHGLAQDGIREAQTVGLPVRLARIALRLSASARKARRNEGRL